MICVDVAVQRQLPHPVQLKLAKTRVGVTSMSYTIVGIDGIKYTLLDFEDLMIVSREFESFLQMWLKPRRGEVFVDIGAQIGKYTIIVAKVVTKEGMVVAIEPHPVNYQTLQRNIRLNKLENVIALNLAAGDRNCELKLFTAGVAARHSTKKIGS